MLYPKPQYVHFFANREDKAQKLKAFGAENGLIVVALEQMRRCPGHHVG